MNDTLSLTTTPNTTGRIVEVAKDRDGSKFIQHRLQVAADPSELQIAYDESLDGIEKLWDDVYGNYILQILLDLGTDEMKDKMCKKIVESGDVVVDLSLKVYG